jgi:peptidoglycan/xylan/chitin deacetylase (PgdA/CDA1 family)
MELGVHTWTHPHLPTLSLSEAMSEIVRTRDYLEDTQGIRPRLFRPPFGEITPAQLRLVREAGLRTVDWSVAIDHSLGDANLNPKRAVSDVMRGIQPGDILLFHDSGAGAGPERGLAFRTLQLLVPKLIHKGFELTSVSTLLKRGPPVLDQPRPWFWQTGFTCP